jgi:hypothetical protein
MKRKWTKAQRAAIGAAVRAAAAIRKQQKLGKVKTVAQVRRAAKETPVAPEKQPYGTREIAAFLSFLKNRKEELTDEYAELERRIEEIDELISNIEDVEL